MPTRQGFQSGSRTLSIAVAALAFAAIGSTQASAAPFSNGGFDPPLSPTATPFALVNTGGMIGNWRVLAGSVDHGTAPAQTTCQSNQCVDLNGNVKGTIVQTFDTCAKPVYRVQFYMSRHKVLGATPATLAALINGAQVATFSHSLPTTAGPNWEMKTFDFVPNSATTTLAFMSTTTAADVRAGPQIDTVTVTQACAR